MSADATREPRAVCVLLGGYGHRVTRRPQGPRVAALLKPWSSAEAQRFERNSTEPLTVPPIR